MTVSDLDRKCKSGTLGRAYFFYGEESFLMEEKIKAIKKSLIPAGTEDLNYLQLDGKKADLDALEEFLESFPQLSERKLAVVKNSGVFSNLNSTEFKCVKKIVEQAAADVCLIFTEENFDKKKEKSLAVFEVAGGIVRFDFLPGNQAEVWLERLFERCEKRVSDRDISYLVRQCGPGLGGIYREFQKLIQFAGERAAITREDIDAVIVKSTEAKIFELFDDIVESRRGSAVQKLKYLLDSGEEALSVLGRLTGNVSDLLMVRLLKEEGLPSENILEYFDFKRPAFVVNKLYSQSKRFGEAFLRRLLYRGLQYDSAVKSGRLDARSSVEMYVSELLG